MGSIEKTVELFKLFPGIGIRQARRFVYFLLHHKDILQKLIETLEELKGETVQCRICRRFFIGKETQTDTCSICSDSSRDTGKLMVVARDVDFEAIEKSGVYDGRYFILGGLLPAIPRKNFPELPVQDLLKLVKETKPQEVILALSTNQEGEATSDQIVDVLSPFDVKVTRLGRGLSTGAEIEYSDPDTLKNALQTRS